MNADQSRQSPSLILSPMPGACRSLLDFMRLPLTVGTFFIVMRSRLPVLLLLVVVFVASAHAVEEILDGIAAVVNKDVITFSQVRELIGARERTLRETFNGQELTKKVTELRLNAINDLIDRQLVLQDFEKNKFSIPEFVIEDHLATIIREQFNNDRQAFVRTLQAQGFTLQRFRKLETDKMIVQAMRQRNVKVNPMLAPGKIEEYYRAHIADFSTPEQIKLRMIVIHKDTTDAESIARDLRAKIKNADDFVRLAKIYSEDSSKESGGDWGWIDRKTLDASLSEPAFALKTGLASDVVTLNGNYYLLLVEARKTGTTKPIAAVRNEASDKILQTERQAAQEKWLKGLRAKAFVKIF